MPRKCPPGVICIENMSFIFLIIVISLGIIIFLQRTQAQILPQRDLRPPVIVQKVLQQRPRMPRSVLLNPYTPPLRNTTFFSSNWGVPINVPTRNINTSYRQVGILTRQGGKETILPLMGRPLHANRNKWQYYTMSDKNNSIKLPVSNNGKSCTSEYGCDNIYNGDTLYAEGYNDAFKVTLYDNEIPRYIPFL